MKRDLILARAAVLGLIADQHSELDVDVIDATAAALEWMMSVDSAESFAAEPDAGAMMTVRYESLIAQPVAEVARVLNFVGLQPDLAPSLSSLIDQNRTAGRSERFALDVSLARSVQCRFEDKLRRLGYF
jgi:LPS sulfotransferase NodH